MKLYVEKKICVGCGLCSRLYPSIFKMNRDKTASPINEEVENSFLSDMKGAIMECPVSAIKIEYEE